MIGIFIPIGIKICTDTDPDKGANSREDKQMTKANIIKKLHGYGEWWANETYSKKSLEKYLSDYERAANMSFEKLVEALINSKINSKN